MVSKSLYNRKLKKFFCLILLLPLAACTFTFVDDITPPPSSSPAQIKTDPVILPSPDIEIEITPTLPISKQEETPADARGNKIVFAGDVINMSGGQIPEDLIVILQGVEAMQLIMSVEAEVTSDGNFIFPEIDHVEGQAFMASVELFDLTFSSEIVYTVDVDPGEVINLNIPFYEKTSDISSLFADRAHVFLAFPAPDRMQVVVYLLISNPGDLVVAGAEPGQPVLIYERPEGAINLPLEDDMMGERYVLTEDGLGDMMSIRPGLQQHEVFFAYEMPYERKLTFSVTFPIPVTTALIAIPEGNISLKSDQLVESGQRTMETEVVNLYTTSEIQAGEEIELSLSGKAGDALSTGGTSTGLVVGLGGFLLVVIASGIWLGLKWKNKQVMSSDNEITRDVEETLIDSIVDLDESYENGELSLYDYEQRRTELKERLRRVIADQ